MKIPATLHSQSVRIAAACLLPLPVALFQWIFWEQIQPSAWFLFYPVLFSAALLGGLWGGLGATCLSAILVWYLFLPPQLSFAVDQIGSPFSAVVFLGTGIAVSIAVARVRRRDERFRKLFAMAADGIIYVDGTGHYLDVNERCCRMLGRSRHKVIGAHLNEMMVGITPEFFAAVGAQLAASGRATFERQLRRKDGSLLPVEVTVAPLDNRQHMAIVHDISGRKSTEDRLRQSEEKATRLFQLSPTPMAVSDLESGRLIDVNAAYSELVGYAWEELIGHTTVELGIVAADARASTLNESADGRIRNAELVVTRKSGATRQCMVAADIVTLPNGSYVLSALTDLTERYAAEQQSAFLSAIVQSSTDAIVGSDPDSIIISWNPGAERTFGYGAAEAVGQHVSFLVPAHQREESYHVLDQMLQGRPIATFAAQRLAKDQRLVDVEITPFLVRDTEGQVVGVSSFYHDITERKRMEAELRINEARFRTMFLEAPLGIALIDSLTAQVIEVNPRFAAIAGRSMEEMATIDWIQITHPDDVQADLDNMALLNAGKISGFQMNKRYIHPDGAPIWISMTIAPLTVEDRSHPRHLCMIEDITERKRTEEALAASEHKYRDLYDHSPDMYMSGSPADHMIRDCNLTLARALGYSREELIGQSNAVVLTPASYAHMIEELPHYRSAGRYENLEVQLRRKDGTVLDVLMSGTLKPDPAGGPALSRVTLHDVTERKQLERALRASEERLRAVIDNSPDVIWSWDHDGSLRSVSGALQAQYGISPELMLQAAASHHALAAQVRDEELTAERLVELGAPSLEFAANWLQAQQAVKQCVRQPGRKIEQEGYVLTADGDVRYIHSTYQGFRRSTAEVEVVSITHDVSPLVRANEEREHTLQQLKLATDAAAIGVWKWNIDDDSLEWDKRICDFYAVPPVEREQGIFYNVWRSRVHPDDLAANEAALNAARASGSEWSSTFRTVLPDGRLRYIYSSCVVERDGFGQALRMIGVNRDVTDQKIYEQYMQDANAVLEQRVAERTADLQATAAELARANAGKDAFMAAISHELRTPLTGVLGMAEALAAQIRGPLTEHQLRYVGLIQSSGQRLLDLVDGVLLYTSLMGGKVLAQREPCRLADLCAVSIRAFQAKAAKKGQLIAVDVQPQDLAVVSDPGLITRTLNLLLDNAIKFTPQDGALGIQVFRVPAAGAVHLVVWDQGIGIEPEQLPHLFDPFTQVDQTLARRFEGVGIGLASVRKLVELLGGAVSVESEPGTGSRFTVTLPA